MKKLLAIDFQEAARPYEYRFETNLMHFNRMKNNLFECNYEGTRDDYTAKMRDVFKAILRDIRALAALYAKYYGQIENDGSRAFVDRQIGLYSRGFNRFIDRYSRSQSWRVIKGLQLPPRLTFGD